MYWVIDYCPCVRSFICLLMVWLSSSICLAQTQTFENHTTGFFGSPSFGLASVAWGDYNGDGWVDISAGGVIYQNSFGSALVSTGVSIGGSAVWGDYDNNGYLDLFSYNNGNLLRYNGTSFADVSSKIPSLSSISEGGVWVDLNNDAHLDLYVGGYEDPGTVPDTILTYNKSSGQFDNTWQETVYRARGVTAADFDRDGDQDVYVSNYRLHPNRLWENNGSGVMTDSAVSRNVAGDAGGSYPYGHTIGSAWGDMDNDGYLDLFVGNFRHNWGDGSQDHAKFLRNPGGSGAFQQMAELDGIDWQESYASPALGDYDNDGDLDLFLTTIYAGDNPRLYRNDGNWTFTNVTEDANMNGITSMGGSYQAAWADVDNDGDLDLASAGHLFINNSQSNGNNWLKMRLEGDGMTVNRSAIGAQVRVHANGQTITRQIEGATGQGNQNDLTMHFGLGSHSGPVSVDILWPNGSQETISDVPINSLFERVMAPLVIDGTPVFNDDFEDDAVGGPPSLGPWHAKNDGVWSTNNKVADGCVVGDPQPVQSSAKYLLLDRAANSGSDGRAYLSDIEGGSVTTGSALASFMLYIPSTNEISASGATNGTIGLGDALIGGGVSVSLGSDVSGDGFVIDYYDLATSGFISSPLTYRYDRWQRWDMSLDVDTGDAILKVDDSFFSWNVGSTGFVVDRVEFEAGWAGLAGATTHNKMYIDAITDPKTVPDVLAITHNGLVVQSDDFENDAIGGPPSLGPWHAKDGNAWSTNNKVLDGSGEGQPLPVQGSTKYLLLDRAGNNASDGRAYLDSLDGGTIVGGTVGASFMMYLPSTNETSAINSQEAFFGLGPSLSGGLYFALGRNDAGGTGAVEYYNGSSWTLIEDISYSQDLWQSWSVLLDVDTGDASLTVGTLTTQFNIGYSSFYVDRLEIEAGYAGSAASTHNKVYIDSGVFSPGDANRDGTVDGDDVAILASYWQTTTGATWSMGDFNGDNAVNDLDATILAANWQVSAVEAQASVPEPGVMGLLVSLMLAVGGIRMNGRG